ncbi:hypothetical protein [Streptomyces decoyicus]|uniref:hypothetical protein n=1 Tax=Streptomyces decoyicus TaxID=249567 RepID=UPI0033B6277F
MQGTQAASLGKQLAEPCDVSIQQRIEWYDALSDQRPQQRPEFLGGSPNCCASTVTASS